MHPFGVQISSQVSPSLTPRLEVVIDRYIQVVADCILLYFHVHAQDMTVLYEQPWSWNMY